MAQLKNNLVTPDTWARLLAGPLNYELNEVQSMLTSDFPKTDKENLLAALLDAKKDVSSDELLGLWNDKNSFELTKLERVEALLDSSISSEIKQEWKN